MKKIIYMIAFMMIFMGSIVSAACDDPQIESINIKAESIETTVLVNSKHDLSDLILQVLYENGDKVEVTKSDEMTITPIDTSKLGPQDLVIKYLDYQITVEINVVAHAEDLYEVIGYEKPREFVQFEDSVRSASKTNDVEFMLGNRTYKVGDDNPFKFLPVITAINPDNIQAGGVEIPKYTSKVTIKENGIELPENFIETVVHVDNTNSTFDFTESAIGRTFEIIVQPMDMDEDASYSPIEIKVQVVDGWNVDSVAELSRVEDNANTASVWATKKQQTGIDNTKIKAIVLHKNLEIKKSDLPTSYFWTADDGVAAEHVGTLKDSYSFFTRDIPFGETFSIYGNYFSISTKNYNEEKPNDTDYIPMVSYLTHDELMGHAAIFSFGGDNEGSPGDPQGSVVIDSLSLKGNGPKDDSETGDVLKGSLIGILSSAHSTTLDNCLTRAFATHLIVDGEYDYAGADLIASHVKNSKMIDSFSAMMFAWASRSNNIENSVLKGSGGPLIIATHADAEESPQHYANINVVNSVLQTDVGGSEAWFNVTGAGEIVAQLKTFNQLIGFASNALIEQELISQIASLTHDITVQGKTVTALNFMATNMESDSVTNSDPIGSETKIVVRDGEEETIISHQKMSGNAMLNILENADIIHGSILSDSFLLECNGAYVTFDLNESDPTKLMSQLSIIITDENVLAAANVGKEEDDKYTFIPVSLYNESHEAVWQNHPLCADPTLKAIIQNEIVKFFTGNYVNTFFGGYALGATFEMFHMAPEA